ncbi:10393_t:CDS:2 [Paraglomus occultum]|uniref:10393_t:CDS:1 n=1 Tax=Paraglomus occultum TaxID=144539 RepID=A0A9N8ZJR1_9GLOM|nr:10393_t:CDS:2 [Paraglomus occultum]
MCSDSYSDRSNSLDSTSSNSSYHSLPDVCTSTTRTDENISFTSDYTISDARPNSLIDSENQTDSLTQVLPHYVTATNVGSTSQHSVRYSQISLNDVVSTCSAPASRRESPLIISTIIGPTSQRESPVHYPQTQVLPTYGTSTGWDIRVPFNNRPATTQPFRSLPQARAALLSLRNLDTNTARQQHHPARLSATRPMGQFGQCGECKSARTGYNWCQYCNNEQFQKNFANWTSGSEDIDDFIQEAQLKATNVRSILEWIDYEEFTNVRHLANGGNSSVFTAYWPRGPIRTWDANNNEWERGWGQENSDVIILKRIRNSNKVTIGFLKEACAYHKFSTLVSHVIHCYGISRCPFTNEFIVVTSYAEDGDLRRYISENFDNFTLQKKIITLRDIASGLVAIHKAGLLHKDLHTGNILLSGTWTMISDLGLCWNNTEPVVKGVLPYVAPEVLRGKSYTRAADVYSIGMIMYELWSGRPPFEGRDCGVQLTLDICSGIRPDLPSDIPAYYSIVMQACWADNPEMRPTSRDLQRTFDNWIEKIANGELICPKIFSNKKSVNLISQRHESRLYSISENGSTSQPIPPLSADQHKLLNKLDERREALYQRCLDVRLIEMAEERSKHQEQVNPMTWTRELKTLADEIFGNSVNTIPITFDTVTTGFEDTRTTTIANSK